MTPAAPGSPLLAPPCGRVLYCSCCPHTTPPCQLPCNAPGGLTCSQCSARAFTQFYAHSSFFHEGSIAESSLLSTSNSFLCDNFPAVQPSQFLRKAPPSSAVHSPRLCFRLWSPKAKWNICYELSLCSKRFSVIFSPLLLSQVLRLSPRPQSPSLLGLEWHKHILLTESKSSLNFLTVWQCQSLTVFPAHCQRLLRVTHHTKHNQLIPGEKSTT